MIDYGDIYYRLWVYRPVLGYHCERVEPKNILGLIRIMKTMIMINEEY